MSKIYKSNHISMGTPKSIINIFKSEARQNPEAEVIIEETAKDDDFAEAANSIIEDAKQMYLKIIEEANTEAKSMVAAADMEAQNLKSVAIESGYKEGYDSGYVEGRREAQSIVDEAAELREFLDIRKEKFYQEAEEQVVQLVLELARKVIGDELTQNNETILSLVNQALQKCAFRKKLVLKISPQDSNFILENKDRICMMVEGISDIDIVSDLSLTQGSCIIETPSGEINSSIDVQIKEIEKIFAYLLRNE
ncbi:MAG TPA: FliH/SctL family protein [Clostridia bacterium]|nr:FliH/SctL family protein [Clostridia bacterium]